jgi:hypothetical protein
MSFLSSVASDDDNDDEDEEEEDEETIRDVAGTIPLCH